MGDKQKIIEDKAKLCDYSRMQWWDMGHNRVGLARRNWDLTS